AQYLAQRFHDANHGKWSTSDLYFFIKRIFIDKESLDNIAPQNADICPLLDIYCADEAPIAGVARHREFIMGSDAEQNGRIGLFVVISNRLSYLAIERRGIRHRRGFAANRIRVFDR